MPPRTRKFIGALALLFGLLVYIILAVAIGIRVPRTPLAELPYYILAGILWIFPAIRIIAWMARGDIDQDAEKD